MQTFLPFEDFALSAEVLDYKRLGKQRVETMQILQTLSGASKGWQNHPAVKMWRGHESVLLDYQFAIISEWINRGYKDNVCWDKSVAAYVSMNVAHKTSPDWLGNKAFHSSHRSNLLQKKPEWYSQFGWSELPGASYVWPI
jgi:hypothetical protein